jgi:hypothetical protein
VEIVVTVPKITLATVVADVISVDEDGESYQDGVETVGDKVAKRIAEAVFQSPEYTSLKTRVTEIRTELIREKLDPIIEAALQNPIRKTNSWGEASGEATTLRDVIMDEAKKAWTPNRNSYSNSDRSIDQVIAEAVRKELHGEVQKAVKKAQEAALKAVGDLAGAPVVDAVRKALGQQ